MKSRIAALAVVTALALAGCSQPDADPVQSPEPNETVAPAEAEASHAEEAAAEGAEPMEEPTEFENADEPYGDVLESWTEADGENAWACVTDLAGSTARIPLPLPQSGGLIDQVEAFRAKAGIEEKPTYMLVEIDSTQASEDATSPGEISWATSQQETQRATDAWELIGQWQDQLPEDDTDLYNESVDLYNQLLEWPNRGAKGESLYVVDGPVDSTIGLQGMLWESCSLEKSLQ